MKMLTKLRTDFSVSHKIIAALTIAAFALVPFAQSNLTSAQEAETCEAISDSVVSDSVTQVDGGNAVAVDIDSETEGNQVPAAWTAVIPDATWIWSDAQNDGAAAPETKVFTREFEFSSDATTTAALEIASDNTYSVTVNTQDAGASAAEDNFSTSDVIDISDLIVDGTNVIEFTVENLGPDDSPAGLLYRIDLEGFDCQPVLPAGEITAPLEGETVSGTTTLEAVYNDGDLDDDDPVQWAVREGACEVGTTTVFGNVDGLSDPSDWDGLDFSADIDTTTVDDGEYCFIFNPTDDEEPETDVRDTVSFLIDNPDDEEPTATTTITVHKVVINDNNGTAVASDFTLLVGAMEVENGVATSVEPDVYVIDEFGTSTINYEASFSGNCDAEGNITIDEGEHLECTITNDDIPEGEQCSAIELELFSNSDTMVNATSSVAVDNDTGTEGNQIPAAWTADIAGATWIWSDAQNDGAAATGTESFSREFQWSSDATTTAMLDIASDNTYSVSINGEEVASSTDEINFTLLTQDSYDVSGMLVDGTNTLEISVTNLGEEDNPAGLLYSLDVDGFECVPVEPDEPDDDGDGGSGGNVINVGDDDDDDDGQVLGDSIDLFDRDDASCELTDEAEDLRDEIESFLQSLENIMEEALDDDDFDDVDDDLADLDDDLDVLLDMMDDAGFDGDANNLQNSFDDLLDAADDDDVDEAEDISFDISNLLEEIDEEIQDECVVDEDFDFEFDDFDDGVVLGDVFPFLPSTGAGGGSVANFILPILLGSGIAVLLIARHRVRHRSSLRSDIAGSIFDR